MEAEIVQLLEKIQNTQAVHSIVLGLILAVLIIVHWVVPLLS